MLRGSTPNSRSSRRAGPEAHALLSAHWESRGVKCHFNQEMLPLKPGDSHYETSAGLRIPVDGTRAFWCTGRDTPNSQMLQANFPRALDQYGYIKIDEHARVTSVPRGNVFAVKVIELDVAELMSACVRSESR